tara:strand:- start:147 stop:461 length:315 start_codon:yes stop_codon:yes gene_type:complete
VNRDWEQDILEWVGDRQVKKLHSNNLIKFVISIFTAIGGFGGGWYKMEQRVSALEAQMAKKENISTIELEIARLKRDRELIDLKYAMKDSLRMEMARYKDKRRK